MLVFWSSGEGDGRHEPPKGRLWGDDGVTVTTGGLVDGNMVIKGLACLKNRSYGREVKRQKCLLSSHGRDVELMLSKEETPRVLGID